MKVVLPKPLRYRRLLAARRERQLRNALWKARCDLATAERIAGELDRMADEMPSGVERFRTRQECWRFRFLAGRLELAILFAAKPKRERRVRVAAAERGHAEF